MKTCTICIGVVWLMSPAAIVLRRFTLKQLVSLLHGCLNEDAKKKKKGQILYNTGRDDQITTSVKLLDIMHKSYGFNADLIEAIN